MNKPFYITTTLPYVNSYPHIGFAMELVRADVLARYKTSQGFDVFSNTGTDEHGIKIYDSAREAGLSPQEFADRVSEKFRLLFNVLDIRKETHFIRTTDPKHIASAQAFWKIVEANGYIYKKHYAIRYCKGCELEKTDSELDGKGRCTFHPDRDLEMIEEENYFFQFSAFQKQLLDFYTSRPDFVIPDFRYNEIKAFVERGLQDFSISRLASKMPWGVPVPGDSGHVMYVWFDALINYISTLGWPDDVERYTHYWIHGNPVQYCGKDNLRQQSAMWQAMLMAANCSPTRHVIINGFLQIDGQKMSKSLGNVISPYDLVATYGEDATRYFVLRDFQDFEDTDVTHEKLYESYNAHLANGLGNLVSRIMKMAETHLTEHPTLHTDPYGDEFRNFMDSFQLGKAIDMLWVQINELDEKIARTQPFILVKTEPESAREIIRELVVELYSLAIRLEPFMPKTARAIQESVKVNKKPDSLFLRKD